MKEKERELLPDDWPVWFWLLLLVLWGLMSCSRTHYVPVETVRIDSISIRDTVIQHELQPYHDSVSLPDTASFLSNPYAYSWARWQHGRLHHSLGIHPFAVVRVKVPYYITRYVYRSEPEIIEVDRKLTRWQRIKLELGGLSMGALVICIALLIVRWLWHKGRK